MLHRINIKAEKRCWGGGQKRLRAIKCSCATFVSKVSNRVLLYSLTLQGKNVFLSPVRANKAKWYLIVNLFS